MILNLAYPAKSSVQYKLTKFSDSHTHITFPELNKYTTDKLTIKTRLASLDDVFILLQTVDAFRTVRPDIVIDLHIAYLICARYDRRMFEGDSFDLKIITDLLSQAKFETITIFEPHSTVSTTLLRAKTLHVLDTPVKEAIAKFPQDKVCIAAPDLGAVKRVEDFAKTLSFEIPVVYCHKDRNPLTGEIRGIKVLNPDQVKENVIIYDDLCDGGKTFTELAKVLRELGKMVAGPNTPEFKPTVSNITLAITHGIFSKGFQEVLGPKDDRLINRIITTNSFRNIAKFECPDVEVIEVI